MKDIGGAWTNEILTQLHERVIIMGQVDSKVINNLAPNTQRVLRRGTKRMKVNQYPLRTLTKHLARIKSDSKNLVTILKKVERLNRLKKVNIESMTVQQIEKLNQLVSRTDMSGNTKVEWLKSFMEEHANNKVEKWISTKDRHPEDCEIVIISGGVGYYSFACNRWFTITHTEIPKIIHWEVTHWMPLPKLSQQSLK